MTAILLTIFFIAILYIIIKLLYSNNNQINKDDTNIKFIEITNEEMSNLKDEDIYNDKSDVPFNGVLYSKATANTGRIQCKYKNGKRHGEYVQDTKDNPDQIFQTKYYKNGLQHGPDTIYYEKFKEGKNAKKKKTYDDPSLPPELAKMMNQMTKKHDVMLQINYKDGLLDGKWIFFNWNGGINTDKTFKQGKKDGVWKEYFQTPLSTGQGSLKKISIFKEDKHVSSIYYNYDFNEITKEEALNDEEWGEEAWEEDQSYI